MFVRRTGKPPVQQGYEKVLSQMMRNRREWQDKDIVSGGTEHGWNPPKGIGETNRAMDHAFAALFRGQPQGIALIGLDETARSTGGYGLRCMDLGFPEMDKGNPDSADQFHAHLARRLLQFPKQDVSAVLARRFSLFCARFRRMTSEMVKPFRMCHPFGKNCMRKNAGESAEATRKDFRPSATANG